MAGRRRKSTKPFGASAGPPPELTLTCFLDECLGRHAVPEALRAAGADVVCHHEHFAPGADDQTWLTELAQHPDVLTKDLRIRRRALELKAMTAAMRRVARRPGPYIARVTRNGAVDIIED